MKHFYLIVSVLVILSGEITAQHFHDKPAVHGMVIFGRDKIYASHLPFFSPPHDYQILLELAMEKTSHADFIRDQQLHPEHATYTIEPETFVLPDRIKTMTAFKANVYRGHFERGGVKILEDVKFEIKRVLHFERFDPLAERGEVPEFLLIGNQREQYAVHKISQKPDYDQIIQVHADPSIMIDSAYVVSFPTKTNSAMEVSGNVINAYSPDRPVRLILLRQLYLEFGDLSDQ